MANAHRVGCLDLLRGNASNDEEARGSVTSVFIGMLVAVELIDVLTAILFIFSVNHWKSSDVAQSWRDANLFAFKEQAWDCVLLSVVRVVVMPGIATLAIRLGRQEAPERPQVTIKAKEPSRCFPCHQAGRAWSSPATMISKREELAASLYAPLSVGEEAKNALVEQEESEPTRRSRNVRATSDGSNAGAVANAEAANDELQARKARARCLKHASMAVLFVASTFFQLYVGLKVSVYELPGKSGQGRHTLEAVFLCISVLWVNLEVFALRTLVMERTRARGLFLKDVHPHPLFLNRNVHLHWCDVCSTRIRDGHAWRCKLCDFDMCSKCAGRKDRGTVAEHMLRSDKGKRKDRQLSSSAYLRRALMLARREWPTFTSAFFLLFAYTATNLALPNFQGKIIDKVSSHNRSAFLETLRIYVIIMALQGLFNAGYSAAFSVVARKILYQVRTLLFNQIIDQDVAFFDGTTSGHLTSKLTNDISTMMEPIRSSLSTLLYNGITLVGGVAMCYWTSYELSMLAFVTVGPIMYLWDLYGTWSKQLTRRMLSALGEGNSIATEALAHVRTVKAFASEPLEKHAYDETAHEALRLGIRDSLGFGVTSALTGYLDLGAGVLILWYGGILVLDDENHMTIGKLITFQLYWNMMNSSYQALQGLFTSFTRSAAAAEKVFNLMDSVADIGGGDDDSFVDEEGSRDHSNDALRENVAVTERRRRALPVDWEVRGEFVLEEVQFHYQMRPDNKVLRGLCLTITGGSVCALVGRSGGGKSTIISMLMRFYDPREGSIKLDGRDLRGLRVSDVRRLIGTVAQDTPLFARTIAGNITYGLEEHEWTIEEVEDAARKAQAHDFIVAMKDGYQTRVGERGGRLSGGQRQRIAIARIFLRKPKICLLDEATSALDEDSQSAVQSALDRLIASGGATVVLVAHRLSTVMNAHKIAVIDQGSVVEEGTHDQLLQRGGVYSSLVRRQMSKKASELAQSAADNDEGEKKAAAATIDQLLDEIGKEKKPNGERASTKQES